MDANPRRTPRGLARPSNEREVASTFEDPHVPARQEDQILGRALSVVRTACGIVGPMAFTIAWALSGRRQEAYSSRHEHISGLGAPDARSPLVMRSGFVTLGACTIAFSWELRRRLGGPDRAGWGPALMGGAGAGSVLAGVLRRDRMANWL